MSPVTLRVLSVACLSLSAASRQPPLAATAAGVGLALYLWSLRSDDSIEDPRSFRWAGLAVLLVLLARFSGSVVRLADSEEVARPIWAGLIVASAVVAIVWGHCRVPRLVSITLAMTAVLFVTGVMLVAEWRSDVGTDVYWMHRGAGEALFDGENPYTDAVRVFNGSPYAPEGAIVEGYPYPPVVLASYGAAGKSADPRLVSAFGWIGVLAWMAWHGSRPTRRSDTAYAMFLMLAGLAVWPVVWFTSWTEPLSVALLLCAGYLWRRRPTSSAFALGLAIASKQYFVFLAPLLLVQQVDAKLKRLAVSVGVATVTILAGFIPDPSAFISATITTLSDLGFRPDTQSLSGLFAANGVELHLPSAVWVALGLGLAFVIARGSTDASDFMGRSGLILGLAFFFGLAFTNYWFIVLALIAIASVLREGEIDAKESADAVGSSGVPAHPLSPRG